MIRKIFFIVVFVFWLTSCSVFPPVKTENPHMYMLNSMPQPHLKKSSAEISLYVAPVEANSIYSTSAMIYSTQPYQIDYFAKNRWVAPPAKMLHPLLVQTLQKSHTFTTVSGSPLGRYDWVLSTQLIQLQQQFLPHSSFIQLVLQAKLTSTSTNQVIAIKQFSITERALSNTPYGGVIAANKATRRLLSAIALFCAHNLDKNVYDEDNYYSKTPY